MRPLHLSLLLVLVTLLTAIASAARPASSIAARQSADEALIERIASASGAAPALYRHAETGAVRFLAAAPGQPLAAPAGLAAASPELASRAFLGEYGQLFGLRDQSSELALMRQEEGVRQRAFVRFQQIYRGVPVLGGELIVQTDQQQAVVSASGELLPGLNISVQPRVAAAAAGRIALGAVARSYGVPAAALRAQAPALWIANPALLGGPGPRVSRLVWRTEVRGDAPVATPIREFVLVDAQTGGLALMFSQIADARRRVVCNDNNVVDPDGNQDNNCTPDKYARSEGQAATGVADVDLAYDYAGDTYDYFFESFGRDSLDGKGMTLVSLVKYCPDADNCPFQNANWNGQQMTYGAGFASADDVVAHELTHGLTEFTSHLFYYYQSGAINESLSDVFGELIDQINLRGDDSAQARWLMGEDLADDFGVIRNMQDPTSLPAGVPGPFFTPSPDRVTSQFYYTGADDQGGVHSNSGVNNKAAFLMADGGTFNGQTISGLGLAKVGAIYYTLQTSLLTSASNYQDLYTNLPAACASLAAGASFGITAADCVQVQRAVEATEMNVLPEGALTRAPACAAGQQLSEIFFDDFEQPDDGRWSSQALAGLNTWFYPATSNPFAFDATYATSGDGNLWGFAAGGSEGEPTPPSDMVIAMTGDVAVPAQARMHFRHSFDFEASTAASYDGGLLEYSTNAGQTWQDAGPLFSENGYNGAIVGGFGNPLAGRSAFVAASQGYGASRLDLSSLAGASVRFRFRIATDNVNGTFGWFIDDLRIYACAPSLPVAAWAGANQTVAEGVGQIQLTVGLSSPAAAQVRLTLAASGSAVAGVDYLPPAAQVAIPAGASSATVAVQILDNAVWSADRTLTLTLTSPQNASVSGTPRSITITDDDPQKQEYRVNLPLLSR